MLFSTLRHRRQGQARRSLNKREEARFRPGLEMLEPRWVPAIFTVNTFADSVAANLTTGQDSTGHISLRSAIQAANFQGGSNTIDVPAGTYRLLLASTVGDLSITDGLTITGAGANVVTVDALGLNRVFEVSSLNAVTLSGLTITGGNVTGHGGGILNSGNLTLLSCAVDGNTATGMDAGSDAVGGEPQNPGTVSGMGGGIYNSGALTFTNCTVSNNKVVGGNGGSPPEGFGGGGGGGLGGGICNDGGGIVRLVNSTLFGNQALGGNGGDAGPPSDTVGGGGGGAGGAGGVGSGANGADGGVGGGGGGAVYGPFIGVNGGSGGQGGLGGGGGGGVGAGGGGLAGGSGGEGVQQVLAGAGGGGGGLGGGLFNNSSSTAGTGAVSLFNCTVTGNEARGGKHGAGDSLDTFPQDGFGLGGGIATMGTLTVQNTIIAGNAVDAHGFRPDVEGNGGLGLGGGSVISAGYNFIGDGNGTWSLGPGDQVGTSAAPLDPKLGPFQDNRGPTNTAAPLPGSPVIDAGAPAFTGPPTTDQRGFARVVHSTIDIGAVEYQYDLAVTGTASPNPVRPGNTVTFNLTVSNNGPDPAGIVTLTDPLPANTTFQSLTAPSGWTATTPGVGATGTVSASIASLPPGMARFVLTVLVNSSPSPSPVLTNTATVGPTTWDTNLTNNSATQKVTTPAPAGIVGRVAQSGQWWVAKSNGSSGFSNSFFTSWSPAVTWVDVHTGDFSGDGRDDIIGRDLASGNWWVGVSNGSSYVTSLWGRWSPAVTWVDVQVGDFNGDGKADIIGRVLHSGQWWVSLSNGTSFTNYLWATWSPNVTWVDVKVGDFNGDGKADITGRVLQSGQWWTGLSTASSFNTSLWATWNPAVTWADVKVGDFNGDGKTDIVGRVLQSGQWWAGISNGSSFTTSLWATWSPNVTWVDIQVGDFNGDGKTDIVGRVLQSGQWWAGISTGSFFSTSLWATWSPNVTWVSVQNGLYG